ncbi:MAG: hypothetical protein HOP10_12150 [Chitinophagaceae bacterium]|nr:hypothetical protein [Chitinophagaceae bacterium]
MKIFLICFLFLAVTTSAYSQQTTPSPVLTKKDYLKKSKNQKTAAWLFLAGGGALIAIGAQDVDDKAGYSDGTRSAAAVVAGIGALGVSTTLFIASARNKRKGEAMAFDFKMEKAPVLQQNGLAYNSYPAISLRIKL